MSDNPSAPPAPPEAVEAPAKVLDLAARHGLGPLVAARRGSNPFANMLFTWVLAAALIGAAVLLGWLGVTALARVAFSAGVVSVLVGFVALLAGFTGAWLFAGGVVHRKNGRSTAAAWSEVREVLLWRGAGLLQGKLLCYYVMTTGGRKLGIEARPTDDSDVFGQQLRAAAAARGVAVVESGPATGRRRV